MPPRRTLIDRSNIDETDPDAFLVKPKDGSIFAKLPTPRPSSQATLQDADAALYGTRAPELRVSIINGQLHFNGFLCTPIGLIPSEDAANAGVSKWQEVGLLLVNLEASLPWLIGDWLIHGDHLKYSDLNQAAFKLDYEPSRLRRYVSVCRSIEFSRRRENLSFKHHEVVASLMPNEQDSVLQYAEDNYLSVYKFRRWLRGSSI